MSGPGGNSHAAGRSEEDVVTQEQESMLKKKYGGLIPKKPPLVSKDHERAFFDSADWALGKQGTTPPNPLLGVSKPRSSMEPLRPKLQPTPHQPLPARRSAYVAPDGEGLPLSTLECYPSGMISCDKVALMHTIFNPSPVDAKLTLKVNLSPLNIEHKFLFQLNSYGIADCTEAVLLYRAS